ncbi:MAG: GNAT family N-acetyltransferase, partial [Faecousia sp.]
QDLYEYLSDPEVVAYEPYKPMTLAETKENLQWRISTEEMIAVEEKATGKMIGNIYLGKREFEALELGYVFRRDRWGKGFARESCEALIDLAFRNGVHRIYAECDPKNPNSWQLLQRLGFQREGTLRQNVYFWKDEEGNPIWKDTYLYARLADVLSFRPAQREDASLLVSLYNAAFHKDFLHYGECPGYGRTQEQMERSLEKYPKTLIFYGEIPVGVLSARETGGGNVSLGCLCVIPEYQGKGIGTRAMAYLETLYPQWRQIRLVTPADKEENIRFYTQRCGFSLAGEERDGSVRVAKLVKHRTV